ncbi:hypothetical protein PAPHI01_0842 [Pancytospora philotis]|nr:hypothetical protein PAPHI01_0842 [Pancytospora philotis]
MDCKWEGCGATGIENMKEHLEEHTRDAAALVCVWEGCPRKRESFSNKYALQAHVRIHTGDKPFKCEVCGRCFSRADALSKHVKRHEASDKQQDKALAKLFYSCQLRDELEGETTRLLEERQLHLNCLRVLHDELLLLGQEVATDSWDDYL